MYRWLAQHRHTANCYAVAGHVSGDEVLLDLISVCEAHGFNVRRDAVNLAPPHSTSSAPVSTVARKFVDSVQHAKARQVPGTTLRERHGPEGCDPPKRACGEISVRVRERVELARRKIDLHYYSKLSCEMLAHAADMSKWYFIKSFKSAFDVSPYRYLMQVRIRHAKRLLHSTPQPLDAIATAVGFDTVSSLCKTFRSIEGVSLSSFFRGIRIGYTPSEAGVSTGKEAAFN
jgi:AraC-like DNA-binding protein